MDKRHVDFIPSITLSARNHSVSKLLVFPPLFQILDLNGSWNNMWGPVMPPGHVSLLEWTECAATTGLVCVAACVAATDGHAAPTPIGDAHEARAASPTPTPRTTNRRGPFLGEVRFDCAPRLHHRRAARDKHWIMSKMPTGFRFPGGARGQDSLGTETAQRRTHTQAATARPVVGVGVGAGPAPPTRVNCLPCPPPPSESTPVNKHTYLQL